MSATAEKRMGGRLGGRLASAGGDILILAKPRITAMVLVATFVGYFLAPAQGIVWGAAALLLAGTLLLGGGVNTLNQYMERDLDRLMVRTHARPLPSGRIAARKALYGGIAASVAGIALLALGANPLSGLIAFTVLVTYLLCYTPLKTRTGLNTLVGAIPGALPPVLGWVAAEGRLATEALSLFMIMFVWQLPHFLAIAWLYREDYANARMPMLTVTDPDGGQTRRQLVLYSAVLVPVSLYPAIIGMAGSAYFYGALGLSLLFLTAAMAMVIQPGQAAARGLLKYSIAYLPLLFGLMLYDKTT